MCVHLLWFCVSKESMKCQHIHKHTQTESIEFSHIYNSNGLRQSHTYLFIVVFSRCFTNVFTFIDESAPTPDHIFPLQKLFHFQTWLSLCYIFKRRVHVIITPIQLACINEFLYSESDTNDGQTIKESKWICFIHHWCGKYTVIIYIAIIDIGNGL